MLSDCPGDASDSNASTRFTTDAGIIASESASWLGDSSPNNTSQRQGGCSVCFNLWVESGGGGGGVIQFQRPLKGARYTQSTVSRAEHRWLPCQQAFYCPWKKLSIALRPLEPLNVMASIVIGARRYGLPTLLMFRLSFPSPTRAAEVFITLA